MEQLIYELNDPVNQASPLRVNYIQQEIQRLQRDQTAWRKGLDMLRHENALVRFYGALTLTIKVNVDWHKDNLDDDEDARASLLEGILTSYVHMTSHNDATFVLQKLCSTMAAVVQKPNSGWSRPIEHLSACVVSGQFVVTDQSPSTRDLLATTMTLEVAHLKGILLPVLTIGEDVNASAKTDVQGQYINNLLQENAIDALCLIKFCLHTHCRQNHLDPFPWIRGGATITQSLPPELPLWALQALPIWLRFVDHVGSQDIPNGDLDSSDVVNQCLILLSACLQIEATAGPTMQALTTLQQVVPALLRRHSPDAVLEVLTTDRARDWLNQLKQGDFDADPMSLMDYIEAVLEQVDFTTPDYFRSGKYLHLLSMLHELLCCAGTAVIEDLVCHTALDLVSSITDGFNDWDSTDDMKEPMLTFIRSCCEACLQKSKIPTSELSETTQEWDADDRSKFQDFRYDVQDFYQAAFAALGPELIAAIVNSVVTKTPDQLDWSNFEARLFILTGFSDTLANEPDQYDPIMEAVFTSPQWHAVLHFGHSVPEHVRRTSIRLLTETSSYLERHGEKVVPALNFLFSSLVSSRSANTASRAIYTVCDQQRRILAEALPGFLTSLSTLHTVGEDERHRIYGAVAAIVQALPSEEEKLNPLSQMLNTLQLSVQDTSNGVLDSEQSLACAIDAIQTLAAIGRGLRAPADRPIDIDTFQQGHAAEFWTIGAGSSLQSLIITIYSNVHTGLAQFDSSIVEACCDFLRCGYTENHPSPFKFTTNTSLELLCELISKESPDPDAVMTCATAFLASTVPDILREGLDKLIEAVCALLIPVVESNEQHSLNVDTGFASSALDFFARILPKWADAWFGMVNGLYSIKVVTQTALLLLEGQDTLPRRTAATFYTALFNLSGIGNELGHDTATTLYDVINQIGPKVLGLLVRMIGGECQRSELETLTETIRKIVQKQPMLAKSVVREAMKSESTVLTPKALQATSPERRAKFAAQVDNLRGARKTNEIVKDFWIACRGGGFDYIA